MVKTLLMRWRLTAITFICVAGLAVTALSSNSHVSQSNEPQVVNKIQAFRIISIERRVDAMHDYFLLRMKNVSSKAINGYTIAFNNYAGVDRGYSSSGEAIPPGGIEEYEVSSQDVVPQEPISIAAVVFTDGTSEGDTVAIARIINGRRGRKLFLERVLPLYQKALNSPNTDIDKLETEISALPDKAESESDDVNYSYRNAKASALREIRELKEARSEGRINSDLRPRLQEIKEEKEKQKGRL